MGCYAVLVDGGFLKRRIGSEQQPLNAQKFQEFLAALGTHSALSPHALHRVYFYDAAPLNESKACPLNGGTINFGASQTATQNRTLHNELVRMSFVALRMGELGFRGWGLRKNVLQAKTDQVTIHAVDLQPTIQQKGVDMRIGLDIAALTLKKIADVIVTQTLVSARGGEKPVKPVADSPEFVAATRRLMDAAQAEIRMTMPNFSSC